MLLWMLHCGLAASTMSSMTSSLPSESPAGVLVSSDPVIVPNGGQFTTMQAIAAASAVAMVVNTPPAAEAPPETSTGEPSRPPIVGPLIASTGNPFILSTEMPAMSSTAFQLITSTEPEISSSPTSTSAFNSTLFVDNLLDLLRKELEVNATINTILVPFEIEATDDDVTDTNLSASVFRGYFSGFSSVVRKDRCSHTSTARNLTVQCLITFRALKSVAYASVKEEERALATVSTSVEDVIFLIDFEGPHNRPAKLEQFKSVLDPSVKPQVVEGSVRSKWLSEFKSQVGINVGKQLMRILYRDFQRVLNTVLSRVNLPPRGGDCC